jgi:hypothetical protein
MNGFQGGVTANDLSPQTYKNSLQTPGIQSTLDSSDIQSGDLNQSINTIPVSGKLVVVGPRPSTLGATTQPINQSANANYVPLALFLIVVSVSLAIYFFNRFRTLSTAENE